MVYGAGGAVNGAITASYANVYAVGQLTEMALRDNERDAKRFLDENGASVLRGIHAVAALIRSKNGHNSPAKGLVPDWHGEVAGSSEK